MSKQNLYLITAGIGLLLLNACAPQTSGEIPGDGEPSVVVLNASLADIAKNIAGERVEIEAIDPAWRGPAHLPTGTVGRGQDRQQPDADRQWSRA